MMMLMVIIAVFITTPGVFASGDNSLERWHLFPAFSSSVESFSSPEKDTCPGLADIIFLIDDSSTVITNQADTLKQVKQFMTDVIDGFSRVGPRGMQFAAMYMSDDSNRSFFLDSYTNADEYKKAVDKFNPTFGVDTRLNDAIKKIRTEYLDRQNGAGRPCANTYIICITDGKTKKLNERRLLTINHTGVVVIAAGIGHTDSKILRDLASNHQIFFLDNTTTVNSLIQTVCEDPLCVDTKTNILEAEGVTPNIPLGEVRQPFEIFGNFTQEDIGGGSIEVHSRGHDNVSNPDDIDRFLNGD